MALKLIHMKKSTATIINCFLILSLLSVNVYAQEATPKNTKATRASKLITEKAGRPDIPGDLIIEFGYNWMQEHPEGYGFNTIKSRTFNAQYLYDINIGKSSFSFHPGLGLSTEKYMFDKNITIGYGLDEEGNSEMQFIPLDSMYSSEVSFKKSMFNPVYLDIPLELRWRLLKNDPKHSLKITIGGKFGLLVDSKTKIKYREDGEAKIDKHKQNFELNPFRYGVYTKIGLGGLSAFYYYSISDLFNTDKGPIGTTMYPMTFGLSLALF